MIAALLLAGMVDPNCLPRHHPRPRAVQSFPYHAHWYHPPPQRVCRDPWPEEHLQDIKLSDLPQSRAPPVSPESPEFGHLPSVVWPGFVPNPPARPGSETQPPVHQPRPGPSSSPVPVVSLPEPAPLALLALGLAGLFARTRRYRVARGKATRVRAP